MDAVDTYVIRQEEPSLFPVPVAEVPRRRRRWPFVVAGVAVALVAVLGAGAAYMFTRGPDLAAFRSGLHQTAELSLSLQAETERVDAPAGLPGFRSALAESARRLDALERSAQAVEQTRYRLALLDAIDAGRRYVAELESLSVLDRELAPAGRDARALELAGEAERAFDAAAALDSDRTIVRQPALSPTPLTSVLTERHGAWTDYEQALAAAKLERHQQQAKLASLQGFTGRMDGIIGRYQDARDELADWIAQVNSEGTTFSEAYGVLYQQEERRSKLREELALVHAAAAFVVDQQALLGIMDDSVSALSAASRGIAEYQGDEGYSYARYSDTPGWQDFSQASDEIADRLDQVLGSYGVRKDSLVARLSKQVRLPKPPLDESPNLTAAAAA
jgi:hypothetical protein